MTPQKKIQKICLLLDEPLLTKCEAMGLNKMVRENRVTIPLIVMRKSASWALQLKWSQRVIAFFIIQTRKIGGLEAPLLKKIPISGIRALQNSKIIYSAAQRISRFGTAIPDQTIAKIQKEGIDLIFRLGFGILKGKILNCVPYGVLSFHDGDIEKYRGGGSRIQAYCNNEPYIYVVAQQITEKLDGGKIILKTPVDIRNLKSYRAVNQKISHTVTVMISKSIQLMNRQDFKPFVPDLTQGQYYPFPAIKNFPLLFIKYLRCEVKRRSRYRPRLKMEKY